MIFVFRIFKSYQVISVHENKFIEGENELISEHLRGSELLKLSTTRALRLDLDFINIFLLQLTYAHTATHLPILTSPITFRVSHNVVLRTETAAFVRREDRSSRDGDRDGVQYVQPVRAVAIPSVSGGCLKFLISAVD